MFPPDEDDKISKPVLTKRKCVIEDVIMRNTRKVEPLFVTFANGQPVEGAHLSGTLHQNITRDRRHQHKRILEIETPGLNYDGTNFGKEVSSLSAKQSVFLGILNKATGKMRLIETSSYCVHPVLESTKTTKALLKKSSDLLTFAEKQEAITSAFGSKRAQQSVNRRKLYQVNAQNMSVAIDQATSSVTLDPTYLEVSQEDKTILAILPECNRKASRPEDVYQLESIAPDNFLAYMEDSARELLDGKDPDPKSTLLFKELLAVAKLEEDEENQVRLTCLALYVEYLVTFLNMKGRDIQHMKVKDKNLQGCPPMIKRHILDEYTHNHLNKRVRSSQNEDRAMCCAMVLSLIASKYQLSLSTLLSSLMVTRDKLNTLMKVVGATYVTAKNSYVLKIPLAKLAKPFKKGGPKKRK
ncbi:DNA-directed RNA polymerase I subunit RPA49-like [Homarus americanus]|uniref:DNA-directed RNA polymerase I subunit RPA49-like n=1 Tax=Homarus americanus TaxID=6706 RepID=UPI001C47ED1E|nr:DNA-directed RNA polymerase I subunit RPA49-like [Homarus americanus]